MENWNYWYTTERLCFGEPSKLLKFAKSENRKLRRRHWKARMVVYPVPGTGFGQLVIKY